MFEGVIEELTRPRGGELRSPERAVGPVDRARFLPLHAATGSLVFIDGGNAAIYESPEARLDVLRVAIVHYAGRRRVRVQRKEGMLLVMHEGASILATSKEFGFTERFDARDDELRFGTEDVQLGTVAGLSRFLIECREAAASDELVIRDGTLQGANHYETAALEEIGRVAGLAKTTTLRTTTGAAAVGTVLARAPPGAWCYPLDERTALVKLHARSEYVFRLDSTDAPGVARQLMTLADDASFPGYPYGLVEADRLARVTQREAMMFRTRFQVEAGAHWAALAQKERALDAHGLLDALAHRNRNRLKEPRQ